MSASPEIDTAVENQEGRVAQRRRSYYHGKIVAKDGGFTLDCVIRNLTESGAKIQIIEEVLFPLRFYLLCTVQKKAFDAELVWRRGDFAGLKFHVVHDLTKVMPPALRTVQKLFAEHAVRPSPGL